MRFEELRLIEPLLSAVRSEGYSELTPIQEKAIPHVLDGRDVLGCAQTGTGKTAAFALPVLQRLSEARAPGKASDGRSPGGRSAGRAIRALVLAPTRELAQQIHDSFAAYGRNTRIRQATVFGGVNQNRQVKAIRDGADVLVATPGRLLDLMGQGLVSLASVEILILDEADRMLDMGFLPPIKKILAAVPNRRQTLLFSATMPQQIRKLAAEILRDPVRVEVTPPSSAAVTVEHWVHFVAASEKPTLLAKLLQDTPHSRALVFTRTKHGADRLTKSLARHGIRAGAIHGNKSQGARTRVLDEFRTAKTPILVATDLAARGLDVDDVSHVINYDLTPDPETYVHRIGRTGRAGATGTAVSFCTTDERENLRGIERLLQAPLQRAEAISISGMPIPERVPRLRSSSERVSRVGSAAPKRGKRTAKNGQSSQNGQTSRGGQSTPATPNEQRGSVSPSQWSRFGRRRRTRRGAAAGAR